MNKKLTIITCSLLLLVVAIFIPEEAKARVDEDQLERLREQAFHSIEKPSKPDRLYIRPLEKREKTRIERTELQNNIERFRETREAQKERTPSFDYQKEMLLRVVNSLLKHAELLRERVGDFPVIHEDVKTAIEAEIEVDVEILGIFKAKVQNADSPETLKELAIKLREHRKEVTQKTVRKLMLLAHIGVYENRILHIATLRVDRIAEKLNEFEELGAEVSALEDLLEQARNTITEASNDLQVVKQEIIVKDIDKTIMAETRNALKNIQNKIRDVYGLFRDIAKQAQGL